MLNPIQLGQQVIESVLAVVGVRAGTEEPSYTRRRLTGTVEIRDYGPRIAAETTVVDDENRARNAGFRRLAGYIFGGNHTDQSISMTAPVGQHPARNAAQISMTAPVAQAVGSDGGWVIRFYMPANWTMDALPAPDDDRVRLVEVPPETVAVLRFSGDRSPKAIAARTSELLDALREKGVRPAGDPGAWFYDPPWTLPPFRRNEIAVPVDPASVPV
ncbi:SOUL family heme-binding protein [Mycobacterium parmense]|uniref:Heme-binding protein n=1 Tax=Mycobacterium parmense TaxID=185642 RepID=A0A7I7YQE5_9MYCO|nr:heme-binding protein [Mycobacterium parmense]MCV7353460.1 heme-binding protein [Mycobacterium parmense]ORW51523.1 heme-binding protein [Mycobacterium parmense]BBZ43980.1 heme-binding protein [Mycobacterium parmense]